MNKNYVKPSVKAFNLTTANILVGSTGVKAGSRLGSEYNSNDTSYGKEADWDDEDE